MTIRNVRGGRVLECRPPVQPASLPKLEAYSECSSVRKARSLSAVTDKFKTFPREGRAHGLAQSSQNTVCEKGLEGRNRAGTKMGTWGAGQGHCSTLRLHPVEAMNLRLSSRERCLSGSLLCRGQA